MTDPNTCRCRGQFAMHKPHPHADRDGSEARAQLEREHERALAAYVPEDKADEVARLRDEVARWTEKAQEAGAAYANANTKHHAEWERANRLEGMAERLAERAVDLEDRARKAEAALARVEAALDIRSRARAWMHHLGYEDHEIDKAEAWRQPVEPWLQGDPPAAVIDLATAAGFAREYEEAIRAALRDPYAEAAS